MGRPLSYARDTAPILFSIEVERKFQSSPHANRLAVPSRRIKFDLPSGLDCFARQTVGQSAGHANVLHFAIAAKNGLQNHCTLHEIGSRDLCIFCLLPILDGWSQTFGHWLASWLIIARGLWVCGRGGFLLSLLRRWFIG